MIKYLLFSFLLTFVLSANENYELKLYEKVLPSIFKSKNISVYTDTYNKTILEKSLIIQIKETCHSADLIIAKKITNIDPICREIPYFSTSYRSYINSTNSIGAFYWRKGRPQLKLNIKAIKKFNLTIPENLKKYAQ